MTVTLDRAKTVVSRVHEALLEIEAGHMDSGTRRRVQRLHVRLHEALPLLAEHFDVPVQTFSGGEEKPKPPGG